MILDFIKMRFENELETIATHLAKPYCDELLGLLEKYKSVLLKRKSSF